MSKKGRIVKARVVARLTRGVRPEGRARWKLEDDKRHTTERLAQITAAIGRGRPPGRSKYDPVVDWMQEHGEQTGEEDPRRLLDAAIEDGVLKIPTKTRPESVFRRVFDRYMERNGK